MKVSYPSFYYTVSSRKAEIMNTQQEMARSILPCDTAKPYAFVSYSKKDYEIVYPIVAELQKEGYNIWIDKELTANVGENWQDIALDTISNKRCSTILFFVSENSMLSAPVCAEITWAHSKFANRYGAMKIIPICASKTWSPKNKGVHQWTLEDLSDIKSGERSVDPAEYDILRLAQMPQELLTGPSRLQYHSDLALHIFEVHFEPNGGNNETFAFFNDPETIKKNIPKEVQNVQDRNPAPDQETIVPAPQETPQKATDGTGDSSSVNNKTGHNKTYTLPDGSRYEGEWANGQCHGAGKLYRPDGSLKYDGNFTNGKREGFGKYYYEAGTRIEGWWKAGKINGAGKEYRPDGTLRYAGAYRNGKREGYGKYYYEDGSRYEGWWKDGRYHGKGKIYAPDGRIYRQGIFENGKYIR